MPQKPPAASKHHACAFTAANIRRCKNWTSSVSHCKVDLANAITKKRKKKNEVKKERKTERKKKERKKEKERKNEKKPPVLAKIKLPPQRACLHLATKKESQL